MAWASEHLLHAVLGHLERGVAGPAREVQTPFRTTAIEARHHRGRRRPSWERRRARRRRARRSPERGCVRLRSRRRRGGRPSARAPPRTSLPASVATTVRPSSPRTSPSVRHARSTRPSSALARPARRPGGAGSSAIRSSRARCPRRPWRRWRVADRCVGPADRSGRRRSSVRTDGAGGPRSRPGVRPAVDAEGGDEILVEFEPHPVAGVDVGAVHPGRLT